jgi:hypothetical protein
MLRRITICTQRGKIRKCLEESQDVREEEIQVIWGVVIGGMCTHSISST